MSKQQTEQFVSSAIDFAKKNGKEAALKEFNNPQGRFTKGDSYIFVIDYQGVFLASPNNPEFIGKNEYDLTDNQGKYMIQKLIQTAKNGGGWVNYHWKNPVTNEVENKASYVMPMEDYLIGSGYYQV